jgi:hypothetical protein
MSATIAPLIERLEQAKFSGKLTIRFTSGTIVSAILKHRLSKDEFRSPIPIVESDSPQKP